MKGIILLNNNERWYYYNLNSESKNSYTINELVDIIEEDDRIFTSQVSCFIREYGRINEELLPDIIDIESYSKQFIQRAKPLECQDHWNLLKLLKEREILPQDYRINKDDILNYLGKIAEFLNEISEESSAYEEDRFESIELVINQIIYETQRVGIAVNSKQIKKNIQSLEEEVYSISNSLQIEYSVFEPENAREQKAWLDKNDIEITGSIERTFKNYRVNNYICKLFYELIRNRKDLNASLDVLYNRGGNERAFPTFHGFGSITSRITLRNPSLQNFRKTNRKIIEPDIGCEFIYIDYSQFEAGILASLSNDKKLQALYNADIYEDMASIILNDKEKRKDAKILFYRYMYGDSTLKQDVKDYFLKFDDLLKYKEKIEKEALDNKLIGTTEGNYRSIEDDNISVTLSHKVQATASLIFKKALIKVYENVDEAEFVLPMHDAALYQVSKHGNDIKLITEKIKKIFIEEFRVACPYINPRVNEESFYA